MDEAVLEVLPKGAQLLSSEKAGSSDWTITTCLSVLLPDKSTKRFFLKAAEGETGRTMLRGEFTATTEIHKVMPTFIPKPYGWGKMQSTSKDTYFFIGEFRRLEPDQRPDKTAFLKRLIELHQTGTSPNGEFGFSVETCDGAVPHDVTWQSNWGDFYARLLQRVAGLDADVNGHWEFLDTVLAITYSRVIPRLLGALSSSGRTLKPSLIHGDMCESNYGIDADTHEIIIWDASSYYAHFEMEMGVWRWAPLMPSFIQTYLDLCGGPSEPVEEFDDRNRLYSVKTKLNFSADGGEEGKKMRIVAYNDLRFLCEKYAPEIELPKEAT